MKFTNLDANESIHFQRELEYVEAKTYDVKRPTAKIANGEIIPISTKIPIGAEQYTYKQFDHAGIAKIIANYATDFPRAAVTGKQFTVNVKSVGASYGYNIQEIRASMYNNQRLDDHLAIAARRSIIERLQNIGFSGDEDTGILGLINQPNIQEYILPADGNENGGSNSTRFIHKTPAQILRDLNGAASQVFRVTKGVESPNTLLLDTFNFDHLNTLARSENTETTTLEYFLGKSPHIRNVDFLNELTDAGDNGTDDVAIMYDRDPQTITFEVPIEFETFAAQQKGMEFEIPVHARTAGVVVKYPLSIIKIQGV